MALSGNTGRAVIQSEQPEHIVDKRGALYIQETDKVGLLISSEIEIAASSLIFFFLTHCTPEIIYTFQFGNAEIA